MASIRNRGGKWQARVNRKGHAPVTKSFISKQDAEKWARSLETEMDRGVYFNTTLAQKTTFAELVSRYVKFVTPTMRSAKEDTFRLNALLRNPICSLNMTELTSQKIAAYRDDRLKMVTAGTVIRELCYFSSIINYARREWELNITNPVTLVRKPSMPKGRDRILNDEEKNRLLVALAATKSNRRNPYMKPIVELALETAMRRGELLSLLWVNVDLGRRIAYLPITKNGESRTVPLSTTALQILSQLPISIDGRVFPINNFAVAAAFMKATKRALIDDFHFHDLRHMAITKMAGKLSNVLELSAVSGHKTLSMLKRYTHFNAEDLAKKLG